MTENDAQQILLVRALERQPASATWTEDDRLHATQQALREAGPQADAPTFISTRARLACERLFTRKPALADLLHRLHWRGWFTPVALLVALLAGALLDSAGGNRINILNPPLLLIIAWNLFTYLVLAGGALVRALGGRGRKGAQDDAGHHHMAPAPGSPSPNGTQRTASSCASRQGTSTPRGSSLPDAPDSPAAVTGSGPFGALRRLVVRLATGQGWSTPAHSDDNLGARFTRQWFAVAAPLYSQRALTLLHAGALMFATGALASLYLHGLVLEYRAGWESTFLVAPQVETLTHGLWGLASLLSGIALPDAAGLEAMRFPQHPGVNAAPWIHLQTLTVVLVVIIPRLLLALWHREQVRKLRTHFPLPLDDTYFRDLLRNQRGESATVWAQPYSYTLSDAARAGLTPLLTPVLGSQIRLRLQPSLALGDEDDLPQPLPHIDGAQLAVAIFSASATPEAENHATFLATLARRLPAGLPLLALVDESAFIARFGHDTARLDSRRTAWRRILGSRSDILPVFVNLAADAQPADVTGQLESLLNAVPA